MTYNQYKNLKLNKKKSQERFTEILCVLKVLFLFPCLWGWLRFTTQFDNDYMLFLGWEKVRFFCILSCIPFDRPSQRCKDPKIFQWIQLTDSSHTSTDTFTLENGEKKKKHIEIMDRHRYLYGMQGFHLLLWHIVKMRKCKYVWIEWWNQYEWRIKKSKLLLQLINSLTKTPEDSGRTDSVTCNVFVCTPNQYFIIQTVFRFGLNNWNGKPSLLLLSNFYSFDLRL